MIIVAIIVLLAIGQSGAQDQSVCVKLESVHESLCPDSPQGRVSNQGTPGKMGAKGQKGDKGDSGSRGPIGAPAEPNYQRVEEIISNRIQAGYVRFID